RAQKGLAKEAIALARYGFRPLVVVDLRPLAGRARPAVPADLLHVVVELQGEAVRVDGKGAVVSAGEELGRQQLHLDIIGFQKLNRIAELTIAAELDAERHERRM